MALSEFEVKRVEKLVGEFIQKIRPPEHIRKKLDIGYRFQGQSVEIFEIRPHWEEPDVILEHSVAKATYVKTTGLWRVFWKRADLKWHGYDPEPTVSRIEDFLALVENDQHCCFFG